MKKKVRYGNRVNLSGLWSKKPVKLYPPQYDDEKSWYDKSGDFGCEKLGLDNKVYHINFCSEDEKEAELWTNGALAVMNILNKWSK